MKTVIKSITAGNVSAFPAVLYLEQFTNSLLNSSSRGTLGRNFHAYGVKLGNSSKFDYLKAKLNSSDNSEKKISIKTLEESFLVFECDDYGSQATSYGYLDLMIMAFNSEGKKLRQSNVGYIRCTTNRKILILLDCKEDENATEDFAFIITPKAIFEDNDKLLVYNDNFWDYKITRNGEDITTNFKYYGNFLDGPNLSNSLIGTLNTVEKNNFSYSAVLSNKSGINISSIVSISDSEYSNLLTENKGLNTSSDSFINDEISNTISAYDFKDEIRKTGNFNPAKDYIFVYEKNTLFGTLKTSNWNEKSTGELEDEIIVGSESGKRTVISSKINTTNTTKISQKDLKEKFLYDNKIYRWNLEGNVFYIFIDGCLKMENNDINPSVGNNITLFSFDNDEPLTSINAAPTNENIWNYSELFNINSSNLSAYLIKENPYLETSNESANYNKEYFAHRLEPGFIPYNDEIVLEVYNKKGDGEEDIIEDKDILFSDNLNSDLYFLKKNSKIDSSSQYLNAYLYTDGGIYKRNLAAVEETLNNIYENQQNAIKESFKKLNSILTNFAKSADEKLKLISKNKIKEYENTKLKETAKTVKKTSNNTFFDYQGFILNNSSVNVSYKYKEKKEDDKEYEYEYLLQYSSNDGEKFFLFFNPFDSKKTSKKEVVCNISTISGTFELVR